MLMAPIVGPLREESTSKDNESVENCNEVTYKSAIEKGALHDVKKLIRQKCGNPNTKFSDGSTPLYLAICANNPKMVQLLIRYKAKVNATVHKDYLLLHAMQVYDEYGCSQPNTDILRELLTHGGNPNVKKRNGGETALHLAARYNMSLDVFHILLKHGADVNTKMINKQTVLMEAVQNCNENVVQLLLKYGADVNCMNGLGQTALYLAVRSQKINFKKGCVRLLLENRADLHVRYNKKTQRGTILHVAVKCGQLEIIYALLNYGCDLNETISATNKTTVLDYAIELSTRKESRNNEEIMNIIVSYIALMDLCSLSINAKDQRTIKEDQFLQMCYDKSILLYSKLHEMEDMKHAMVSSDISMYDIFVTKPSEMKKFVENERVVEFFSSSRNLYKFDVFAPCLRRKVQDTLKMHALYINAKRSLAYTFLVSFKKDVPWEVVQNIMSYLNSKDLEALSKIAVPPKLLSCLKTCSEIYPDT